MTRPDDATLVEIAAGGRDSFASLLRDTLIWIFVGPDDADLGGNLLRAMAQELLELRAVMRCTAMRCAICDGDPDARDRARIAADLGQQRSKVLPVAWYCPKCAPDLELVASGLAWEVVEIGGASAEDGTC